MENFENLFNSSQYDISISGKSLAEASVKLKVVCKNLIANFNEAADIIKSSEIYWAATSSENLIELSKEAVDQAETLNRRFSKEINNLDMIISIYDESENKQISDSTDLLGSILE